MFRQLVKHELIATRRLVPFIWLVTAVIAAIHLIASQIDIQWLAGTSMVFLILLAISQVIITYVVVVMRYYKSLYSDEGYLTHTLPVKAGSLLGSKVLTSFIWLILSYLVAGAVLVIVMAAMNSQRDLTLLQMYREIQSAIGFTDTQAALLTGLVILFIIYSLLLQLAQLFFAMSFGSQSAFHRLGLAGPIITYLVLNFLLEMAMLVMMVFVPLSLKINLDMNGRPTGDLDLVGYGMIEMIRNPQTASPIIGLGGILFTVLAMAALYWGSHRLIERRTSLR
ncbi:MAG: hypothetical protein PHP40_06360 [Eubacteriales bacterium]|nr:hypothetical protein [Eubacteriales bacterium]